jgi:hypothetical protein
MPSTPTETLAGPEAGGTARRPSMAHGAAVPRGAREARPHDGQATGIGDLALVRLLAGWSDAPPGRPTTPIVEALGRWLHWTDAIALSEALDHRPTAPARAADATTLQAEVARRRAALAAELAEDAELRAELDLPGSSPEAILAACRRHHAERQRSLEAGVSALRAQLRAALAARGGDWARLAAVDRALAEALGRRERVLLASVPSLMAARLQRRLHAATTDATGAPPQRAAALCADLQQQLKAELDLRLQPVLGLLAALCPPDQGAPPP